ncbi:proline-specific permease [Penicillium manginii]|uniref:proline-specific permease n=1 Tax=Penicillium manginii TaxID=203109 RepID=UPI002546A56D|nr:proline-specific permease [Penicillium manginii]KAJ5734610.1 proline-specific permease [Penicillium manginii]
MITINATIGTGLYWRGGQVLELGGPLAVVLSFLLVGFLSWSVMQCVSEMLCIWPIPGALSAYVSEFVDVELGIATGVAYWFTYSISFSTLIATSAAEFNFWPSIQESTGIHAGILYLLIPVAIVCANSLEIELILIEIKIYGIIEVITGTIKLLLLAVIICVLIAINRGAFKYLKCSAFNIRFKKWVFIVTLQLVLNILLNNRNLDWKSATEFDSDAAGNWFAALLIGMSIATFSFVGIEIVAASALEAKWPRQDHKSKVSSSLDITPRPNDTLIGNQIKFSAIFISVLATVVYVVAAFLVTLDIYRGDCALPRVSWLSEDIKSNCTAPGSKAAFVAIALESGIPHLADLFNVFLIFTCLTCTSTNLYVASRTLFGLTSGLEGGKGQRWYLRILAWFGKTNRHQVPIRAVIFSAVSFSWVPFLQLIGKPDTRSSINEFIEILSQMASIGVLIVWGMNCLAFLRYHKCISVHENQKIFKARGVPQFQRDDYSEYPYRSHGQPLLAYFAFSGCFFLLIVAGGAALWKSWNLLPFLASYLPVLAFFALWVLLKIARRAPWGLVDLSDGHMVATKLQRLHEIRGATQI